MNNFEIVELDSKNLRDAAELVVQNHRRQREQICILPECNERVEVIEAKLEKLWMKMPAVGAFEDGRLVGVLSGMAIQAFKGTGRGIYSPEWSHATAGSSDRDIYRHMYAKISDLWVQNGCYTHAITIMAHNQNAIDTWFWNGFGLLSVDALRDLRALDLKLPSGIEIKRARITDIPQLLPLVEELQRHLAGAPTFLPLLEFDSSTDYEAFLSNPDNALWIAYKDRHAISYIQCSANASNAVNLVRDKGTIAINGAYTSKDYRGHNVATALLAEVINYAHEHGFQRCSVDFESQNIYASRFWLRHFTPVTYSLIRKVDDRIAWGHGNRTRENVF